MKAILFGATGMIGHGVLHAALADPRIEKVLAVGRRTSGHQHVKLDEVIIEDFFDYEAIEERLKGYEACFFCLGISAAGQSEPAYRHITYDLTLAVAQTLVRLNPTMTFCYISAAGADQASDSLQMWARVKGETEKALSALSFPSVYHFRPAYIQPVDGARSSTPLYRAAYALASPLYPVLRRFFPAHVTTTEEVGQAFVEAGVEGASRSVIDTRIIHGLARQYRSDQATPR